MEAFVAGCGPVVCCATTSEVERIASKNGMGFCELVEAFSLMSATQAPLSKLTFRSAARHVTLVGGLRARFLRAAEMVPTSVEAADPLLHSGVRAGDEAANLEEMLGGKKSSSSEFSRRRGNAGWFGRWRSALEKSLRHSEYDAFECPALCLLVVATSEPAGLEAALEELATARHVARCFGTGQFDDRLTPKQVVVVHDVGEAGPASLARDSLAAARALLPALGRGGPPATFARLVPVNSLDADDESAQFRRLSAEDFDELQRFASELIHSGVVPTLEKRVASLHATVSTSRKGVRNVLKSWLRRPRELGLGGDQEGVAAWSPARDASLPAPRYGHETIEAQIRLLADATFVVGDYETAVATYRLARDDFKADRSLAHLGAANEMIARSLLAMARDQLTGDVSSPPAAASSVVVGAAAGGASDGKVARRDAIAAVDAATAALSAAAGEAREEPGRGSPRRATWLARMLTRASLVAADVHASWPRDPSPGRDKCRKKEANKERSPAERAADALVSAAQFESNLNAAVLYEQAAWRYRAGGLDRKCALHLVMAGHRYRACGEDEHAVECYVASRDAYRETYFKRREREEEPVFQLGTDEFGGAFGAFGGALATRPAAGWARIDEHVEHALGRQLEALGHHALALRCTLSLLASARAPADRHAALIRNFVAACAARPRALAAAAANSNFGGGGDRPYDPAVVAALAEPPDEDRRGGLDDVVVLGLPLPTVLDDAVAARTPDEIAEGRADDRLGWATELARDLDVETAEDFGACVEACVEDRRRRRESARAAAKASGEMMARREPTALRKTVVAQPVDASTRAARSSHWPRWCARAEAVEVDVVFRNAFAAPVDLADVHLVCTVDVDRDFAATPFKEEDDEKNLFFEKTPSNDDDEDDAFLLELRKLADAVDRGGGEKNKKNTLVLSERVHVTLPPGGSGAQGGALVRLRCGAAAARGTFRVVGVRWRLQGTVWGAHAFARRGPRLHRTRAERADRARAPDASLAFHVAGDAPRLVARVAVLDDDQTSTTPRWVASSSPALPRAGSENFLHGEVRRAYLELSNVGRATAGRVRIRCAGPWLAVGPACETFLQARNAEAVDSGRFGFSGLSWRAATLAGDDLALPAGSTTWLPLSLRARGAGGKEPLRLVVQYVPRARRPPDALFQPRGWPPYPRDDAEAPPNSFFIDYDGGGKKVVAPDRLYRASDDDAAALARRAPLSLDVCVLPALAVAVAAPDAHAFRLSKQDLETRPISEWNLKRPPKTDDDDQHQTAIGVSARFDAPDESVLSLQLANYCSNQALKVSRVRCVDNDPDASSTFSIAALDDETAAGVVEVDQTVGWNEQLVLHFKVLHDRVPAGRRRGADDDAAVALLGVDKAHAKFEAAVKARELEPDVVEAPRHVSVIRRENDEKNETDQKKKTADSSLALVVSWETPEGRNGQHHVLSVPICLAVPDGKTCPVAVALEVPPVARARFYPQPPRFKPSDRFEEKPFRRRERAAVPVVARVVNRRPPDSPPITIRIDVLDDARGHVEWFGKTRAFFRDLKPWVESEPLRLEASIARPGVFDLNLLRATVFYDEPTRDDLFEDIPETGETFEFEAPYFVITLNDEDALPVDEFGIDDIMKRYEEHRRQQPPTTTEGLERENEEEERAPAVDRAETDPHHHHHHHQGREEEKNDPVVPVPLPVPVPPLAPLVKAPPPPVTPPTPRAEDHLGAPPEDPLGGTGFVTGGTGATSASVIAASAAAAAAAAATSTSAAEEEDAPPPPPPSLGAV
ncbi:hypothetical protein CTAYLR_002044 [Chrysophaeum taylorii]|uniref:Uncharacterized protein n=1 Tax=Chrysophaeum taylorii TaxID=2483200 RepID=A0AAD7UP86_9STRA|nr:hypothetical protein CTAYLR_002044 [Chrysophaeum taylorii]